MLFLSWCAEFSIKHNPEKGCSDTLGVKKDWCDPTGIKSTCDDIINDGSHHYVCERSYCYITAENVHLILPFHFVVSVSSQFWCAGTQL